MRHLVLSLVGAVLLVSCSAVRAGAPTTSPSPACTSADVSMAYEQAHPVGARGATMVTSPLGEAQLVPCSGSPDAWSDAILSLAGEEHWNATGYLPIDDMIQIGLDRQASLAPRFFYTLDHTGGTALYPPVAAQFGHSYRFAIALQGKVWRLTIDDLDGQHVWSGTTPATWRSIKVAWWDFETSKGSPLDTGGMRISATDVELSGWRSAAVEPCRVAYASAACGLDAGGFYALP